MYGICKFCLVQVRNEPDERSELVTQLLFGDVYEIIEGSQDKKWFKIKISYDNYIGWIDAKLHFEISEDFYDQYLMTQHPICYDSNNWLVWGIEKREVFPIVAGSTLPFYSPQKISDKKIKKTDRIKKKNQKHPSNFLFGLINAFGSGKTGDETYEFEGTVLLPGKRNNIKFLMITALEFYGAPYLWGGKTVFGTDCSGFLQQIFKICGYDLPRDAHQQAKHGQIVNSYKDSQPGDIAFFENSEGKISHVGIIMVKNLVLHASQHVKFNNIDAKGIFNKETKAYSHNLKLIKRIFIK